MTDHPVLVPTSIGPLGAIVSEPERTPRAAALFLGGIAGRRFGINQVWTRTAWDLADAGLVVLRPDYPGGSGDSSGARATRAVEPVIEILEWFRRQTGDPDVLLIGACFGARLVSKLAETRPKLLGAGLVVPAFRPENDLRISRLRRRVRERLRASGRSVPVDRGLTESLRRAVQRAPVWVLVGARDLRTRGELRTLQRRLGPAGDALVVEEVPDLALHGQASLQAQREVRRRTTRWATGRLRQEVRA